MMGLVLVCMTTLCIIVALLLLHAAHKVVIRA